MHAKWTLHRNVLCGHKFTFIMLQSKKVIIVQNKLSVKTERRKITFLNFEDAETATI